MARPVAERGLFGTVMKQSMTVALSAAVDEAPDADEVDEDCCPWEAFEAAVPLTGAAEDTAFADAVVGALPIGRPNLPWHSAVSSIKTAKTL